MEGVAVAANHDTVQLLKKMAEGDLRTPGHDIRRAGHACQKPYAQSLICGYRSVNHALLAGLRGWQHDALAVKRGRPMRRLHGDQGDRLAHTVQRDFLRFSGIMPTVGIRR